MSQTRVRLNNLSTQKVSGRSLRLSRLSRKRFPFPSAGAAIIPNYIEEVFSTYLYTGNGSTQTITNGVDLAGKGGLVWIKNRVDGAFWHCLYDTVRGATKQIYSNRTEAQDTEATSLTAFNTNGFSLGSYIATNTNGNAHASWTFRKQAKFFDVVTYTGNGTARTIPHNLGSEPGCIIVKSTTSALHWNVYHRGLPSPEWYLELDQTNAYNFNSAYWNNTAPTSSVFSVGTSAETNTNGATYVAYLFAHNAGGFGAAGTDNVISCGSYTGTGAAGNFVSLGYEPQWVLIKNASAAQDWFLFDSMRGLVTGSGGDLYLNPNLSSAEGAAGTYVAANATGFTLEGGTTGLNGSAATYIYIAIRRGPMRTPTSGTSVYDAITYTGNGIARSITGLGFPLDLNITGIRDNSGSVTVNGTVTDRLRGGLTTGAPRLFTTSTSENSADSTSITTFDLMNGYKIGGTDGTVNSTLYTYVSWNFRRAPGFFDIVCYTGTGANRTVSHNLAAVPELIITKGRNAALAGYDWFTYSATLGNTKFLYINGSAAEQSGLGSTYWNSTTPTSSVFSLGTNLGVNTNGGLYVAYLFATLPGVSKVGSYTGTGTTLSVDCGFTAGARFVMIKRTDTTGDWYVWDSARGIIAGNDPYLRLNVITAEITSTDYIDPYNPGFELSSTAPAALNASGGTYIFLAIA